MKEMETAEMVTPYEVRDGYVSIVSVKLDGTSILFELKEPLNIASEEYRLFKEQTIGFFSRVRAGKKIAPPPPKLIRDGNKFLPVKYRGFTKICEEGAISIWKEIVEQLKQELPRDTVITHQILTDTLKRLGHTHNTSFAYGYLAYIKKNSLTPEGKVRRVNPDDIIAPDNPGAIGKRLLDEQKAMIEIR